MSTTGNDRPQFRGAFMGYNKAEVDDYVALPEKEILELEGEYREAQYTGAEFTGMEEKNEKKP